VKADPISVGKVLSENHRFVVPIYQRTYAWTERKQLEQLFEQIEAKAQERLQKGKVDFPHYTSDSGRRSYFRQSASIRHR
jgi:uncharacterized protein with ParB-like and HNH nuclease domain